MCPLPLSAFAYHRSYHVGDGGDDDVDEIDADSDADVDGGN